MYKLQEYIKDQLVIEQLILEDGSKGISYNVNDNTLTIDCKYCTIKVFIDNVSFLAKDKELLSGKEIFDNIDLENIENTDVPALIKFLQEKKEIIDERAEKFQLKDVTDYILRLKDAQLWPPMGTKLDEMKLECYLDFTMNFSFTGPIAALIAQDIKKLGFFEPRIDVGDLHVTGLGKLNTKVFLKSFLTLSGSFYKILFYIFKNIINTDEKSFKSISKSIEQGIKKGVNDDIDALKKLPDTVEKDENADLSSIVQQVSGMFNKK